MSKILCEKSGRLYCDKRRVLNVVTVEIQNGAPTVDANTELTGQNNTPQVKTARIRGYLFFKRFFDIVCSLIAGVILLLPMLVIAVIIRIDSNGTALFRQERLGLNGKTFMIVKFRSMRPDAEADGPKWADKDDARCTRVGRVLRASRLDELPQLWNIFIGNMSFVGPRPEREYFYDKFEETVPGFRKRLTVKPGLTGLAQVNGGYDLNPEEKLKYDLAYIHTRSVMLDLKCMLKTVKLIFSHEGAR